MQGYIDFNAEILPAGKPIFTSSNRSFRYGDGLFESIRIINKKPVFLKEHFQRLQKGADFLQMKLPEYLNLPYLRERVQILIKENQLASDGRLRLSVFRNDGGLYLPLSNDSSYLLELEPLSGNGYTLNPDGLKTGFCPVVVRPAQELSNYKTMNCLIPVMASVWAKNHGLNDCLLLNDRGRVCEASSSSVFFVMDGGQVVTPPLSEGCLDGVMRSIVLRLLKDKNIAIGEQPVEMKQVLQAKEVFFTNAIKGVQWVRVLEDRQFSCNLSKQIIEILNQE
jgi:branched-subunit amino acid aminotransferase/4-amino-4-deoxychorismate lyase